jgi:aminoglycoside/choline kinase family phosphotransferase
LDQSAKSRLTLLFEQWSGENILSMTQLPPSGSYRYYFRITSTSKKVLGAINHDVKENMAFLEFSRFFREQKLPVPDIYAVSDEKDCYLLQDLGDTTLFDLLSNSRTGQDIPAPVLDLYKQSIHELVRFQLSGRHLDYSFCYPRASFDKQSMMWDLHYFKYYFLKLAKIPFDEQLLEDDFNQFADFLLKTDCSFFLFRDFQSRNIMVTDGKPTLIDYQGGRQGALQYDLASLLYDAKANLPQPVREELLNHYMEELTRHIAVDAGAFKAHYHGYVLIRIMQAMGAYGFRGFYEKKELFLKSIPYALTNLRYILENYSVTHPFASINGGPVKGCEFGNTAANRLAAGTYHYNYQLFLQTGHPA